MFSVFHFQKENFDSSHIYFCSWCLLTFWSDCAPPSSWSPPTFWAGRPSGRDTLAARLRCRGLAACRAARGRVERRLPHTGGRILERGWCQDIEGRTWAGRSRDSGRPVEEAVRATRGSRRKGRDCLPGRVPPPAALGCEGSTRQDAGPEPPPGI